MKRHVSRMLAGSLLALSMTGALAADEKRAAEISAQRCSICHGKEGESASPIYPRLAGQNAEYIARQLADFKSGKRASETMKPQAQDLTPEEMAALASFFAQKPGKARRAGDPELLGVGRYVFDHGNRFSGLPACASCHGAKGHGTPQLPRLAGQHPRYVEEQLKQFNKRERTNDNAIMHTVASKLTEMEAHAVAEYVATLD